MPMMVRKHFLTKDCMRMLLLLHVSDPCKRTDFTSVLNIRRFVFLDIVLDFHTGLGIMKAVLAFPILI